MVKNNYIIKYNLESRAKELLLDGKTYYSIAKILTEELGKNIDKASVGRYFRANEKIAAQLIEKNEKIKARFVEAEISTIEHRFEVINGLMELAKEAEADNTKVQAFKAVNEALDSLDSRLGKLKGTAQTSINVVNYQEAVSGAREVLASRLSGIAARIGESRVIEQSN